MGQSLRTGEPQYVDLLKIIRNLLNAKKKYTTIAKVLNANHVPPRIGTTWHHTAVSLIACERNGASLCGKRAAMYPDRR